MTTTTPAAATPARPLSLLLCALGGEGGGVLAEWLYAAAVHAGHPAQSTSIPGVAQRTGATTYYVEIHPEPADRLGGRRPVFGLAPVPGAVDLLVSSELLETLRQVGAGMSSAGRTLVISSTARALTTVEKMAQGDGRIDDAALLAVLQRHCRGAELLDLGALAAQAGTVISAVMFGAIAASGVLPFGREACEEVIRASGKGVDASLRGFALAFDALAARRAQRERAEQALAAPAGQAERTDHALGRAPEPDLRALGRARVAAYQDEAYARQYDDRLARVDAAERAGDPTGAHGGAIGREMARWLALWMAFDDIVRVAALKLAASRQERVRREVKAGAGDVVKVYDHFKPGVPELAALLPQGLAGRLLAWDRRRVAAGHEPWALPLMVGTHTLAGTLALRMVAALKGQRRRGSRFAQEQALIERWLAAVEAGAREHWALGHELAQCGRLIKGYGSTNERAKANLLHIVDQLARAPRPADERAGAVRAARAAALADEAGQQRAQVLVAHGAAKRAPREQPIRFVRRRRAA
ncbi:MAG: indolepyruvate oxidoreductase subunit beta family protein [Burkholderiales bacterium]|nr:indolepyruvate oxidoreductase subunit beta family protein [Burkholderiales bacterium]